MRIELLPDQTSVTYNALLHYRDHVTNSTREANACNNTLRLIYRRTGKLIRQRCAVRLDDDGCRTLIKALAAYQRVRGLNKHEYDAIWDVRQKLSPLGAVTRTYTGAAS